MPIDGGGLNAHNARTKDFRRRKMAKLKGSEVLRSTSNEKIEFETIDPLELKKIKETIQEKARKRRRIDVLLIILSVVIALLFFFLITAKYS
jgi:hypothetical protein